MRTAFENDRNVERASIVLIGDSFLEAGIVAQDATVSSLLEDRLRVPVSNLGMTMYGPQQELAALRRYGLPLRPQVVLWFLFEGNDFRDAVRYERRRSSVKSLLEERAGFPERSLLNNAGAILMRSNLTRLTARAAIVPP